MAFDFDAEIIVEPRFSGFFCYSEIIHYCEVSTILMIVYNFEYNLKKCPLLRVVCPPLMRSSYVVLILKLVALLQNARG